MKNGKYVYIEYIDSDAEIHENVKVSYLDQDSAVMLENEEGYFWIPFLVIKRLCVRDKPFETEEDNDE